jgi:hypothetical protein
MTTKKILLVEDNPADEDLTLRARKQDRIASAVVAARHGSRRSIAGFP